MLSYRNFMVSALCALAVVAAAFVVAPAAHAAVVVYEGFDYDNGDLVGNNGGTNGVGSWTSAWGNSVDSPTGCQSCFEVSGNEAQSDPTVSGVNQGVERTLNGGLAAGTTVYFGFDMKRFGASAGQVWGMHLDVPGNGVANELNIIGWSALPAVEGWRLHGNIKSGGVGWEPMADGEYERIVGKLEWDVDGANERLSVWHDPTSEDVAPTFVHHSQDLGNGSVLDGMAFGLFGRDLYGEPAWGFDEFNITTTFAEAANTAIPEPTTLGLLAVSLAGCLVSPRRRR